MSDQPMSAPLAKRLHCVPSSIEDACQTMEEAAVRIEELEAKASILARCCERVDCLSRGEAIDAARSAKT